MVDKRKHLARGLAKAANISHQDATNLLEGGRAARAAGSDDDYAKRRTAFRTQSLAQWEAAVSPLLAGGAERVRWQAAPAVAAVLERVAAEAPLNHCFLPVSGGLDLTGARLSAVEPASVELELQGQIHIGRVAHLELVHPNGDRLHEWTYLRLQFRSLEPSGVYGNYDGEDRESLVEVQPGRYVSRDCWDTGSFEEEGVAQQLPLTARTVNRYFGGAVAIFPKASTYNALPTSYSGVHSRLDAEAFAVQIQTIVTELCASSLYGRDMRR